jgi:enterochelin esterase family protein
MSAAEAHPETATGGANPTEVFEERMFPVPGGGRRVVIYRPARMNAPLPIVYFHDGSLMIDKGGVPQILDRLVASGRLGPLVAVFVDPVSRADDYRADRTFREWFVRELVPVVESALPFPPTRRAVIGVSRGATAAIDLAWQHPDVFNRCGLLILDLADGSHRTNRTNAG